MDFSLLAFLAFVVVWAAVCRRWIRWARLSDLRAERRRRFAEN
jgi:hypothetical protein